MTMEELQKHAPRVSNMIHAYSLFILLLVQMFSILGDSD